jgi:hypothetical protein
VRHLGLTSSNATDELCRFSTNRRERSLASHPCGYRGRAGLFAAQPGVTVQYQCETAATALKMLCRVTAEGYMKNKLIAGLWLALIIGPPAGAGYGSVRIGLGLFLLIFLAFGVAPAIYVGKVKSRK